MTLLEILPIALLGAVLGLDVVSFPQAMISRPLVAATLAGAAVGNVLAGLLLGAALELIALETLPFGASRYPEWGSASVVGGAAVGSVPAGQADALMIGVLVSLATAWVSSWSMVMLRRANAVWAGRCRDELEAGTRSTVLRLQFLGMAADLLRAGLLTLVALAVVLPVRDYALAHWTLDARLSRAIVAAVAATVAAGAAWKIFHSTVGARWYFLGGLAVGFLLLVLG